MIIHIGGPPGAGKSTLLKNFKKQLKKYKIIDLDDLGYKIKCSFKNLETFKKEFQKTYQNKIDEINKNNKNVLYVGMHFTDPRMEFKGKEVFVKPFELTLNADKKYCLNPGVETIVKQCVMRHIANTNISKEKKD